MKLHYAAALALVLLVGCGPDMTVINDGTQRAEAAASAAERRP